MTDQEAAKRKQETIADLMDILHGERGTAEAIYAAVQAGKVRHMSVKER